MPELSELSFFIAASLLLIIAPGPDIIFLITRSLSNGPAAGVSTALGLACGNLVHTVAAVLGVSAVFQTSEVAFNGLKIAGVCYLVYLAYEAITQSTAIQFEEDHRSTQPSLFMRGVLMNVLNPKVSLFFLAFLPQFVDTEAAPVWSQMMFYGIAFTVLVIIVFGCIGLFAGVIQSKFFTRQSKLGWFRWITATIYISLAIRLIFVQK